MKISQMMVTRKLAEQFLRKNDNNRSFRDSYCEEWCGIIRRGAFQMTHQGIAIATDGTLLDGQHRLHAIVRTGISCQMVVATDCDKELYELIDRGRTRTTADALHITMRQASAARFLHMVPTAPGASHSCTTDQVRHVMEWAGQAIDLVLQATPTVKKVKTSAPIAGACIIRVMQGGDRAKHALRTFKAFVNHEDMPPICRTFANQLDRGDVSVRRNLWDLSARAWIAFDLRRATNDRIQIKDKLHSITEMQDALSRYHIAHTPAVAEAAD
jgi:hypothetical protein